MAESTTGPSLRASIESFDYSARLLIALAARAAAVSRLPADAHIRVDDINIINERLGTASISSSQDNKVQKPESAKSEEISEVDVNEVQEQAKLITAAQAEEAPKLSEEEQRAEREKQKRLLQTVESGNQAAAVERRRVAKEWADDVAHHCGLGKYSIIQPIEAGSSK